MKFKTRWTLYSVHKGVILIRNESRIAKAAIAKKETPILFME
jgi:hypothetical protein